jgi:hypothetical protein
MSSDAPSTALRDVAAERARQIAVEGWTPEHDDEHGSGEMAAAAAAYAFRAHTATKDVARYYAADPLDFWPWASSWWKPTTPRRDLIKAAALIVAEIERLDRSALSHPAPPPPSEEI